MHPTCGGKIAGHYGNAKAEIVVATSIFSCTTTLTVKDLLSESVWTTTVIELDEQERCRLIALLGGTP